LGVVVVAKQALNDKWSIRRQRLLHAAVDRFRRLAPLESNAKY
jgi:hypothetical protein